MLECKALGWMPIPGGWGVGRANNNELTMVKTQDLAYPQVTFLKPNMTCPSKYRIGTGRDQCRRYRREERRDMPESWYDGPSSLSAVWI